jgi:predicted enzyme related to lactoylglutathione lyase
MAQPPPVRVTYMLMAEDPGRARRFYQEGLRAHVAWAAPDGSWTVLRFGDREVCLHGNGTGAVVDTGLAVEVDDLEQACAALERAGGRVLRPARAEWLAIVTDTEGNRLCVVRRGGCVRHPSLFPDAAGARSTGST